MRSFFLYGLKDAQQASVYLDERLAPNGEGEWILQSGSRTVAWLRVDPQPELFGDEGDEVIELGPCIVADLSSALPDLKPDLIAFLKVAQTKLGGAIRDDYDELVSPASVN